MKRFCPYCNRENKVSAAAFAENPFCRKCLKERMEKAAAELGPRFNVSDGHYCHSLPVVEASEALRAAAFRLLNSRMRECKHLFNAHHQCQWCHVMQADIEADLVACYALRAMQLETEAAQIPKRKKAK